MNIPPEKSKHQTQQVIVDGKQIKPLDLVSVARDGHAVIFSPEAIERMQASRALVERVILERRVVYGVSTGVGELRNISIPFEDVKRLQQNIIRSHAAGVGEPLPKDVVRATMLLRAHTLARGYSGVRSEIVELLIGMLNAGVHPLIPEQGSVGASGDLAPLAHLALALTGEGRVFYRQECMPAAKALQSAGLSPVQLEPKEGLALINGTQVMTAIGVLALVDAERLVKVADVAASMSLEALLGTDVALSPSLHDLRPHPGQGTSAANMRALVDGNETIALGRLKTVQDAYSLRCAPQVHGAMRDTLSFVRSVLEIEMSSVTDNPICLPENDAIVAGGNFHGQPVAFASDFLAIAVAALANISGCRVERLVNPYLSGLPAFLARKNGLNSGYMLAQYTAAALVSENKILAHPASVDSIPTSANQEDHVSMGTIAARKAARVIRNAQYVLGIELVCAAQALEFRDKRRGRGTEAAYQMVRKRIAPLDDDRCVAEDLEVAAELVRDRGLVEAVEASIGPLK